MSERTRLLSNVASLTSGAMRVIDERTGWPGLVEITVGSKVARISLHVGRVGVSSRGRDGVERRYQNPASCDPIVALPGTMPMLLGLWTETSVPVLVAHNAQLRVGRGGTRVSLFVGLAALQNAASTGWGEHVSGIGERIIAFRADLFPVYAEMFVRDVLVDPNATASILESAGVAQGDPLSVERARRATSTLVRSTKFREEVVAAYAGSCAMCSLALGLPEGAHIYPASAPGASDVVQNGLALCPNHHTAFDRYLIWIDPSTRQVRLHPELVKAAASPVARAFVSSTAAVLFEPLSPKNRPSDQMIEARNRYFADAYSWAG